MRQLTRMLVVVILLAALIVPFGTIAAQEESGQITVTGEAEVRVVPDEVILTLGVETWDASIVAAKSLNDERVTRIIETAKSNAIPDERIQTDFISIEPRFEDGYQRENFIGYFVRKTIVITLRDISAFETLLTAVLEAGATHIHGIEFRTTKLREHRDEARALAIRAAREKAVAMAGELGLEVGEAKNIQEDQGWWWSSYNSWWGSSGSFLTQNVVQNAPAGGSSEAGSTFAPGQIAVNARVTITFSLTA